MTDAQEPALSVAAPTLRDGGGDQAELSGATLYSDPCNNATGGCASQEFPSFPSFSCRTTDDFTVPINKEWHIEGFGAEGAYSVDPLPPGCVGYYFFEIYPDAGGAPDCTTLIYSAAVPPGATGMTDGANCVGDPIGRFDYCPPGGPLLILPAGRYWFSAGISMIGPPSCGQWFWRGSTAPHQSGRPYFDNPGGGFGVPRCVPWTSLGLDQDQAFAVYGTQANACDPCAIRSGNVDTGSGGSPADVIALNGGVGGACREVSVTAGSRNALSVAAAPCCAKGQYGLWIFDGVPTCQDRAPVNLLTGKGVLFNLGLGARCLPVSNTVAPGSCPCPVTFPVGRTSRSMGSSTAALLCLNKKPGFSRAPVSFSQAFPPGDFVIGAVVQDTNSINSPAKNISIANWIVVHSM